MKTLIYGAGALGSALASALASGSEVGVLGRDPHIFAVASGGLTVTGARRGSLRLECFHDPNEALAWGPELIILTVKAWDTQRAGQEMVDSLRAAAGTAGGDDGNGGRVPGVSQRTTAGARRNDDKDPRDAGPVSFREGATAPAVLSVQNGLGNLERLNETLGPGWTLLGGTTGTGAYLEEPGHVHFAGEGSTVLGIWSGGGPEHGSGGVEEQNPPGESRGVAALQSAADLFNSCGLECQTTADLRGELWMKAIINASINPLMAITGHRNGFLLRDDRLMETSGAACLEGAAAARACGLEMSDGETDSRRLDVIRRTSENKCSMLQDVERGRRTEVEFINGELVLRGTAAGVNMPVNRTLWSLVRGLEPHTFAGP